MPDNGSKLANIVAIITLAQNLTPTAISLIRALTEDLSGRTDEEVLNEADSILARVKAKATAAQAEPTDAP